MHIFEPPVDFGSSNPADFPIGTTAAASPDVAGDASSSIVVGQSAAWNVVRAPAVRVLHLINGEHFSGAERVQQNLGKHLDEFGFAAHFLCLKPGKFKQLAGLADDRVHESGMRSRFDLGIVRQVVRTIKDEGFELLHAHTPRTALVAAMAARWANVPWVYHIHSPTARDSTRGLINRINDLVERAAVSTCDLMITVSRSLRREMLGRGISRKRVTAIANGVAPIEAIRPEERMRSHRWQLGLIALMRPRKGIEVALHAMSALKQMGAPVSLDLIGGFETADYQQRIEQMVRDLDVGDVVRLSGFTSDVPSAVRRLDALLLPSLFGEGMPMVVLEALSAGVPVVATRVEGTPEVVRDGIEGYLAEPRDADDLAEKISLLTSDRRCWATMSRNAVARHRSRYSDTEMARRVARAYRKLLFTPPPALDPGSIFGIEDVV